MAQNENNRGYAQMSKNTVVDKMARIGGLVALEEL